jgi:uncharacterized protein
MRTVILLTLSNVFMTTAWYLHLRKEFVAIPLWKVILGSWLIAFFEYCLQVPANRIGQEVEGFSPAQLKIVQEVITIVVFCVFSVFVLNRPIKLRHLAAFALVFAAVAVVMTGKDEPEEEPAAAITAPSAEG